MRIVHALHIDPLIGLATAILEEFESLFEEAAPTHFLDHCDIGKVDEEVQVAIHHVMTLANIDRKLSSSQPLILRMRRGKELLQQSSERTIQLDGLNHTITLRIR